MTLVVAMANDAQHLEQMLNPLFTSYNVKPDRVDVIMSGKNYDAMDTRSFKHGNLLRVDNGDVVSNLTSRGIPEQDAMYYAQGLSQGKDVILVNVEDDMSARVADYFRQNRMTETLNSNNAATTSTKTNKATTAAMNTATANTNVSARKNDAGEETFEVIEESLKVGSRTVEKGGVKVEKRVTTTPVQEDVVLKEEHAVVHRKPVNRMANAADLDDAFTEHTYEVREYAQEAVVQKEARVVEEVTLGKYTEEHTETIRDNVKRIDVNIEHIDADSAKWSYDSLRPTYMKYHTDTFSKSGKFDKFENAYRFGHAYALDERTRTMSYDELQPHMQKDWGTRYEQSAWEDFKDQVSYAWHTVKSKFD